MKRFLIFIACAFATATAAEDGVTSNSIKIGVMGPFTGNASSYSKAQIGLDAWALGVQRATTLSCH